MVYDTPKSFTPTMKTLQDRWQTLRELAVKELAALEPLEPSQPVIIHKVAAPAA